MPDGWTLVQPKAAAPAAAADTSGWSLVEKRSKPAAAEDFIETRTTPAREKAKGVLKGAVSSLSGLGEMMANAGMLPGVLPNAFGPEEMRNPTFRRVEEATTATNADQQTGKYLETAAELAVPAYEVGKLGVMAAKAVPGLVKSAPGVAKAVAQGLASDTPLLTQARQAIAKKVLSHVFDDAGKAAKVAEPAIFTGTEAAMPTRIPAAGGFSMPVATPKPVVAPPPGRVVAPPARQSVEEALAGVIEEARAPSPPARVTVAPEPSLPPGYTPRSTVPKPVKMTGGPPTPKAAKPPEPPKRAYFLRSPEEVAEAAAAPVKATPVGQQRPYFLKSPEEIAAASETAAEAVTPTGKIDIADLPASWKSHTGQDLFPTTGVEGKEIAEAMMAELSARGLSTGEARALISKNRTLPTKVRSQLMFALGKAGKK